MAFNPQSSPPRQPQKFAQLPQVDLSKQRQKFDRLADLYATTYTEIMMVYPGKDTPCLQRIPFVHREKISKKLCEIRKKRNLPMRWNPSNVFQQEMKQNFKIAVIENQVLYVTFGFESCIIWQLKTKDLMIDENGNGSEITLYAIAEENRFQGVDNNVQDWELVHDDQIRDAFGVYDYFCAKSGVFSGTGVSINGIFVQTLESFREQIFNWLPGSSELQVDKKLLFNSNGEKEIEIELDEAAIRRNLKSQKNPRKYKSICTSMEKLEYNNLDTFCDIIIQTMYSEMIPMIENNNNNGDFIEIQRYFKDGKVHDEFILPLEMKCGDYYFKASIACIPQRDENDRVYGIVGRAVNPAFVTMSNVALAHENGEVPITSWVSQMYNNRHSFFEQLQAEPSQSVLQLQFQQQQQQQQQQQHQQQELTHTQGQQAQQREQGQHGAAPPHQVDGSTLAFVQCQQNQNEENKENEVNTAAATSGVRTIHSRNNFGQGLMVNSNVDGGKNEKKENNVYIGNVLVKSVQGSSGWYGDRNRKIDERRMKCSVLNNKEYGQTQGQEAPKKAKESRKEYSTVGGNITIEETEEEEKVEKNKTDAGRNKTKNTTQNADHNNNKQSLVGTITTPAGKELEFEQKSEFVKISNARIDSKIISNENGSRNSTCNDSGGIAIGRMGNSGDNYNNDDATKEKKKEKEKKKTIGNSNAVPVQAREANVEEKNLEEKENINNEMNMNVLNVGFEKIDSYESSPFSTSSYASVGGSISCRARLLGTHETLPQEMILGLNEKLKLQDQKREKDGNINIFGRGGTLRWLQGKFKLQLEECDAHAVLLAPIITPIERCGSNRKKMEKMEKMKKVNRLDKDDQLIMKLMVSIVNVNKNDHGSGVGLTKPLVNNYGSCDCDDNEMNDASSLILDGIKGKKNNDENKRKNSTCSHSGWTGGKNEFE